MKIYEMELGTEVTLVILFGDKTLNLKSSCVGTKGKDILIAAVRVDGKVINLETGELKVSVMIDREQDKPLMWTDCEIKMIVAKNNVMVRIGSKYDAKEVNRRGDFRLAIGGAAKGRIGRNKEALQMTLRDVSYSGFAVIIDPNVPYEIGGPIRVVHKDEELKTVLDLVGKIVRMEDRNGRTLLGCKLDLPSPILGKYIGEKQQRILANRMGNNSSNE